MLYISNHYAFTVTVQPRASRFDLDVRPDALGTAFVPPLRSHVPLEPPAVSKAARIASTAVWINAFSSALKVKQVADIVPPA
jgi:hypothetical protein